MEPDRVELELYPVGTVTLQLCVPGEQETTNMGNIELDSLPSTVAVQRVPTSNPVSWKVIVPGKVMADAKLLDTKQKNAEKDKIVIKNTVTTLL
jgi:hypothetical protein